MLSLSKHGAGFFNGLLGSAIQIRGEAPRGRRRRETVPGLAAPERRSGAVGAQLQKGIKAVRHSSVMHCFTVGATADTVAP